MPRKGGVRGDLRSKRAREPTATAKAASANSGLQTFLLCPGFSAVWITFNHSKR